MRSRGHQQPPRNINQHSGAHLVTARIGVQLDRDRVVEDYRICESELVPLGHALLLAVTAMFFDQARQRGTAWKTSAAFLQSCVDGSPRFSSRFRNDAALAIGPPPRTPVIFVSPGQNLFDSHWRKLRSVSLATFL